MIQYPEFVNKIECCPSDKEYRYSLDIECENSDNMNKIAMIIMQNPSKAKIDESDRTVNNVLNYLYGFGYGRIIITNVVPFYGTDIADIMKKNYKNKRIIDKNNEIIKSKGDMADKIFAAWGWIYPKQKLSKESLKILEDYYNERIDKIKEGFCNRKKLYCFCINSEGRNVNKKYKQPRHGLRWRKGKKESEFKIFEFSE